MPGSLRVRLLIAALIAVSLALIVAFVGLVGTHKAYIQKRFVTELDNVVFHLAGALERNEAGEISLSQEPADPRYDQPLSGLYWQVQTNDAAVQLRSRSLWEEALDPPENALARGAAGTYRLPGPGDTRLLVRERRVQLEGPPDVEFRILSAIDLAEFEELLAEYNFDLALTMLFLGLVLVLAGLAQVHYGLRPLELVRQRLQPIRDGTSNALDGAFPVEVQPLVTELNLLLGEKRAEVDKARARAGELAHALKTPLTVLAADARRLREAGQADLAGSLEATGEAMRRSVERELARSRAAVRAGAGPASIEVRPVVEGLLETLRRTPDGEHKVFRVDIDPLTSVGVEREDFTEVLGNLLENAARFAERNIIVQMHRRDGDALDLVVEDDGPGIPPSMLNAAMERGRRLDERGNGSGLGLAIAADIAEIYGGSLHLNGSSMGGLKAVVRFPSGTRAS